MKFRARILFLSTCIWGLSATSAADEKVPRGPSVKEIEALALQFKDPDKFIDRLLVKYPSLRTQKSLVYRSRSPERDSASEVFPRVLLGSINPQLYIAFTGDPSKPDYNKIQMIDPVTGAREIVFSTEKNRKPVIHAQPESCKECHGEKTNRLIFDSYNYWPGMFGSHEDDRPAAEVDKWKIFLEKTYGKGRYKFLFDRKPLVEADKKNEQTFKFDSPELHVAMLASEVGNFNNMLLISAVDQLSQEIKSLKNYKQSKYAFFAAALGCDNFESFLPADSKGKSFEETRIDTLKHLEAYHKSRRDFGLKTGVPVKTDIKELGNQQYADFSVSRMRLVAERMGMSTESWGFTFEPGSFAFMASGNNILNIQELLAIPGFEELMEISQTAFFSGIDDDGKRIDEKFKPLIEGCESMLAAFKKLKPSERTTTTSAENEATRKPDLGIHASPDTQTKADIKTPERSASPSIELGKKLVQEKCLRCHKSSDENIFLADNYDHIGTEIAKSSATLDRWMELTNPKTPAVNRMPRRAPALSDEERVSLRMFLESLKPKSAIELIEENNSEKKHLEAPAAD